MSRRPARKERVLDSVKFPSPSSRRSLWRCSRPPLTFVVKPGKPGAQGASRTRSGCGVGGQAPADFLFAAGARPPPPALRPLRSAWRARRMRRPSRRTTSTPIWPRIGSPLGREAHVYPGIRPRSGGAADQRRLALGGGPAVTRTSAGRRGRGASGGGEAGRILRGRFEDPTTINT